MARTSRKSRWTTPQALEEEFAFLLRVAGIDPGEREHEFHPVRRWKFDFCWPDKKVAAEIEGQSWGKTVVCHQCGVKVLKYTKGGKPSYVREAGGRHTRGAGFESDVEKYNEAARLGWVVLRFTADMIKKRSGECLDLLRDVRRGR